MKILYIVHDMYLGGVTTIVNSLIREMRSRGHQVYLIVLKSVDSDVFFENKNVLILDIKRKFDYFPALLRLIKYVKENNPDVIHSHTVLSNILTIIIKKYFLKNQKVICTEHSSLTIEQSKSLIFKLAKPLYKYADKITFVSNFSMSSYLELGVTFDFNSEVVHNGVVDQYVNPENVEKIKRDFNYSSASIYFCYVGRVSVEKNLELLIEAFSKLSDKNIKLLIVGGGCEIYTRKLFNMVEELNLTNVYFAGYRSDVSDIISFVDCCVLSSKIEGLPTVLIEAFSKSKVAISTLCGGVGEIISDERFLADNNNVNSLVDKLNFYLALNPSEKIRIGDLNRRTYLEKFNIESMVSKYINLYEETNV